MYVDSGGGIVGAVSMIDGALECDEITVGWYDLRAEYGLLVLLRKQDWFFKRDSTAGRGDWAGFRRDLLREGPSGIVGNNGAMSPVCSLQDATPSSSALRDARKFGIVAEGFFFFFKQALRGRGRRFDGTYGRLLGSSTDVNKRTCEALLA
jgi:hypothetical protein